MVGPGIRAGVGHCRIAVPNTPNQEANKERDVPNRYLTLLKSVGSIMASLERKIRQSLAWWLAETWIGC